MYAKHGAADLPDKRGAGTKNPTGLWLSPLVCRARPQVASAGTREKGQGRARLAVHTTREIGSTYEGAARADPSGMRLRERACGSHQV
jgi:hypothetical protein